MYRQNSLISLLQAGFLCNSTFSGSVSILFTSGRTNERKDGPTNGRTNGLTGGKTQSNPITEKYINLNAIGWLDAPSSKQTNGPSNFLGGHVTTNFHGILQRLCSRHCFGGTVTDRQKYVKSKKICKNRCYILSLETCSSGDKKIEL